MKNDFWGSCDTEDRSNDVEISYFPSIKEIKYILKYFTKNVF